MVRAKGLRVAGLMGTKAKVASEPAHLDHESGPGWGRRAEGDTGLDVWDVSQMGNV
jgi:hypothetical protein